MIIVKLWGGMCNQMFQYAFGYALSKLTNDQLAFDIDFYNNQPSHVGVRNVIGPHQLPNLTLLNFISRPFLANLFENRYISHIIRYNVGCNFNTFGRRIFIEKLHRYYPQIPHREDYINYYDGYWQTSKYFNNYAAEIRQEFDPPIHIKDKVKKWRSSINSLDCIAVHIRRGDYLNKINQDTLNDGNVIGNISYYLRAIDYINNKLEKPVFCFFSDDIEWCRQTFKNININALFVENTGNDAALLDLYSIAQCEHGIMSPSTFSWWGNWLRKNSRESIVIAPKGKYSNECFVEDNWITL